MVSFEEWIAPMLAPLPELPDGMIYDGDTLQPLVQCSVCEKWFEWPGDIEEFDNDCREHHYCGGSPRCCP